MNLQIHDVEAVRVGVVWLQRVENGVVVVEPLHFLNCGADTECAPRDTN